MLVGLSKRQAFAHQTTDCARATINHGALPEWSLRLFIEQKMRREHKSRRSRDWRSLVSAKENTSRWFMRNDAFRGGRRRQVLISREANRSLCLYVWVFGRKYEYSNTRHDAIDTRNYCRVEIEILKEKVGDIHRIPIRVLLCSWSIVHDSNFSRLICCLICFIRV